METEATALKKCLESSGKDCEKAFSIIDLSSAIPNGEEMNIMAATVLESTCYQP